MEWLKKNKWHALVGGLFLASLSLILFSLYSIHSNKVVHGVSYGDLDLSGLTREEAKIRVEKYLEDKKDQEIRLKSDVTSYKYKLDELGFRVKPDLVVEEAFKVGRDKKSLYNIIDVLNCLVVSKSIQAPLDTNKAKMDKVIEELEEKINRDSKNATLTFDQEGKTNLSPDRDGTKLNVAKTKEALEGLQIGQDLVLLPVEKVKAKVKKEDLTFVNGVLATFSTDYSKSEDNRKDNIALGASFFSEMIVQPGQEVSFLKTINGITKENGFKESGVIISGEFDRGIGGGICQVSTTIYNALIRADLEIVERHNHSRPIGYVPRSTDAAVVEGYKDLVFRNNYKTPIYLMAKTDGHDMEFTVYGNKEEKPYDIEIVPESLGTIQPKTETRYSPSLYEGDQKVEKSGARGYSYRTWRVKIKDGQELERTLLNKSYYVPQNKVVLVGTKARPSSDESNEDNNNNN